MRTRTKILFLLYLAISFVATSCNDWLDINQNPNAPSELEYEELLASGISSVAYVAGGRYQVLGALWSQHWTQSPGASQYSGLDSYDINSSTFDNNQFGELYSGALKNLEEVRLGALDDKEWNFYLIATCMQAYAFQILVDLYGDIPFSQALKGEQGITEPEYESGISVYDSLINRLDFALSHEFDSEDLKDAGNKDLLFNGDIERWIEFANTLKLKIFLRQIYVRPEVSENGIRAMYAANADFLSTHAQLKVFTDESGRRNPVYDTDVSTFGGNPNLIMSNTVYSYLLENGDLERLDNLFDKPAVGGSHKALVQGNYYAPDEDAGINSNSYSKPYLYADDPVFLISYEESCFLQAEAIIRYQTDDFSEARDLYNKAVKASFNRVLNRVSIHKYGTTVSTDIIAESALSGNYSFPSEGSEQETFIKSIIEQKWIALSGTQNLETFFEQNRTGYPQESPVPADDNAYVPGELSVSVNNVTSGKFPRRLIYPESEYASNRNTPDLKEVWVNIWWDID
ncbi:MAG: SusD/RagB family nutrient-binding outer membrane lipoprotein [Bacteroidales bacterium]|nr:SusD/RagB family nutrient-binding outer membrane lipoprotein [Bacteroidales bacterium]MBN2819709.1 SusD/RagB family nutrient-binding outer membrane lipoprotein [Bacteroidales bacterium]